MSRFIYRQRRSSIQRDVYICTKTRYATNSRHGYWFETKYPDIDEIGDYVKIPDTLVKLTYLEFPT